MTRVTAEGNRRSRAIANGTREECGPPDSNGNVRDRIQTNERCESANDRGDTYGPVNYIAYIPGFLAFDILLDRLPHDPMGRTSALGGKLLHPPLQCVVDLDRSRHGRCLIDK